MARMIFFCKKCNSTYGADSGTINECPDCKVALVETKITSRGKYITIQCLLRTQGKSQIINLEKEEQAKTSRRKKIKIRE